MSGFTVRQRVNLQLALIKGALLSYSRDGAAIFFTLLFPLIFMVIFGLLNFGGGSNVSEPSVGVVDGAGSEAAGQLIGILQSDDVPLSVTVFDSVAAGRESVSAGDTEVLVVVPSDFAYAGDVPSEPAALAIEYQAGEVVALSIVQSVLGSVIDGLVLDAAPAEYVAANYVTLSVSEPISVSGREVSYRVFLIPGILAMAIMQTGVFGIVFAFVRYKVTGVLRRFQGTPAGIAPFLFSEMTSRLVIIAFSTAVLMGIGAALFGDYRDFLLENGIGSIAATLLLSVLGGFVFVGLGLAISGRTRSENAASGIANLATFPMLFLSGVFFSTSVLPDWLEPITRFLPLSFLIEAVRRVQIDGAALWSAEVGWSVLGLLVWGIACFIIARLLFRWQ